MKHLHNLTDAIEAPELTSDNQPIASHAFGREFALMTLSPGEVAAYLVCGPDAMPSSSASYYQVLFRFRHSDSAVLGLLWAQEEGRWRLKSYRTFEM